jgi:hypothetical protein
MSTSKFCVYLTTYLGNKLPMFYIGSTSLTKYQNGYLGSVSSKKYKNVWRNEIQQNPQLFKTKIIKIYDTRKEAFDKEEKLQKQLNVIRNPLYINMSFANSKFTLKQHSPYTKLCYKNRIPWNKGKLGIYSEHTLEKMKKSNKGRVRSPMSIETKEKLKGPNPKKGHPGQLNGMYGKTHSKNVKEQLSLIPIKNFKGKTYEEIYGIERAIELKKRKSESLKGKNNSFKNNPRFDNTEYCFFNTVTGEVIHCTRWVLVHYYGVNSSSAVGLINQCKTVNNWCLLLT